MNIRIPKGFVYETPSGYAHEENGRLYVRNIEIEPLMRELTYAIKGRNRCYYCGCTLHKRNRTVDHMYPRHWGGVTIPDNLVPCCMKCNTQKGDLTHEQYKKWLTLSDEKRKKFRTRANLENARYLEHGKLLMKPTWVDYMNVEELNRRFPESKRRHFKNSNRKGKATDVIYLCNQGVWIAKGFNLLERATRENRKTVPVIRLSNVTYLH